MVTCDTVGRRGHNSDSPGGNGELTATSANQDAVETTTNQHNNQQQTKKTKQTTLLQFTTKKNNTTPTTQPINNSQPTQKRKRDQDDDPTNEAWGDIMQQKSESCYRICFENINGLGFDVHHNIKQDRFITWAKENEIDVMGWAEININWRMTTPSEKLRERLRAGQWNKMSVSTAHNIHEKLTKYQPGGVSLLTFDQLSHRVTSSGSDPSGLGRWTWQCIRCRTRSIRIISAYQPNITVGEEKQTVYAQQKRYLRYIQRSDLCPREAFRRDFENELQPWMDKNEVIILMMDVNDDLRNGLTHQWLTDTLGLRNSIHTHHPNLEPPSTYSRNFRNKPIDGCYVSHNLPIEKGGFLPFRAGIGDHRILYIDINIDTWFEGAMFKIAPLQVRKLQCGDVRVARKYQTERKKLLDNRDISARVERLYTSFQIPLTEEQQCEYE